MDMVYSKENFERIYDDDSGKSFENLRFEKCSFRNCGISVTRNPKNRSRFRNIELIRCTAKACHVGPGIFEDCLIDGLGTFGDLLQTFAAVFHHVKIAGKVDRMMLSAVPIDVYQWPELRRQFEEQNDEYYENVDWALDISRAEFKECSIRGIPAHLIRRDPETQVVITRQSAMRGEWRNLDLSETYWPTAIQVFLDESYPNLVLVAPKGAKDFKKLLRGIRLLREAGVAEPD